MNLPTSTRWPSRFAASWPRSKRGELVAGPAARSFLAGALAALDAARTGQAIEPPDLNR